MIGQPIVLDLTHNATVITIFFKGATKNGTGHWNSHCWQAEMSGYNLVLTPGYQQSKCDCQVCSIFWGNFGPFVAMKNDLDDFLDATITNEAMAFVDFFLQLSKKVISNEPI